MPCLPSWSGVQGPMSEPHQRRRKLHELGWLQRKLQREGQIIRDGAVDLGDGMVRGPGGRDDAASGDRGRSLTGHARPDHSVMWGLATSDRAGSGKQMANRFSGSC